ncbi:unnamed protein product, partial [Notodromas monacha]
MKLLEGKTAIITGATRGIGKSIAQEFIKHGANVVFTYVASKDKADALEAELNQTGVAIAVQSSAEDFEAAQALIDLTVAKFGQIDIVINNAGITKDNLLMRMSVDDWKQVIDVNLSAVYNLTKAAMKPMLKQRSGSIINMSSVVGIKGNAGQANYAASKAGIIGFTKSVAIELGSRNIRCNAIAPGFIETEMTAALDQKVVEGWASAIPLKRGGQPLDVANACVFLSSDMSRSRNAPLNLAFHLDDFFTVHSIVDERSAGFVALGMAQQLKQPVAICCTSGSAAVNYYPAVVEAFYQNIPLVVITADRPADLVDQFEGQTIRQNGLFSNHVHNQTVLNENLDADSQDQLMDCLTHLYQHQGPVHINMPFTEPLYQQAISQTWTWETHSTLVNNDPMDDALKRIWQNSPKRLILLGMHPPSPTLDALIDYWLQDGRTVVLSETTSNGHHPLLIHGIDQCITNMDPLDLPLFYPDLVMTVGQNVISKRIKSFLRAAQPHHIWHIDRHWAPETYGLITHHWAYALEDIMDIWIHQMPITHGEYQSRWVNIQTLKIKKHRSFQTEFSDWQAIYALSQSIPADWQIQWGNSSIVRYAQLMQWPKSIVHYANRGVSGIDGSTSTAVGACMVSGQNTLL